MGTILLWYGSFATIPFGWVLCDGKMGTPDLHGFFIRGAGGVSPVGETGDALHEHTASIASHRHRWSDLDEGLLFGSNYGDYTDYEVDTLTTNNDFVRPPFHHLAYIMKVN